MNRIIWCFFTTSEWDYIWISTRSPGRVTCAAGKILDPFQQFDQIETVVFNNIGIFLTSKKSRLVIYDKY